jgi:hypothetical protein
MATKHKEVTGKDLLDFLKSLSEADLGRPLSVPGIYGEHQAIDLPQLARSRRDRKSNKETLKVLEFPGVSVGRDYTSTL